VQSEKKRLAKKKKNNHKLTNKTRKNWDTELEKRETRTTRRSLWTLNERKIDRGETQINKKESNQIKHSRNSRGPKTTDIPSDAVGRKRVAERRPAQIIPKYKNRSTETPQKKVKREQKRTRQHRKIIIART